MPEYATTVEVWFEAPDPEAADDTAREFAAMVLAHPWVRTTEAAAAEPQD